MYKCIFGPIPSNAHRRIRQLYCKSQIREHNNVDPSKKAIKGSVASESVLLTYMYIKAEVFFYGVNNSPVQLIVPTQPIVTSL